MKPLSSMNYYKNNKKRFITSVISVFVAVSFIYMLYAFVGSLNKSLYILNVSSSHNYSKISSYGTKQNISDNILQKLRNNPDVDKLIPLRSYGLRYSIPGSFTSAKAEAIKHADMNYFMKMDKLKIREGRLPEDGASEVAINNMVAMNRGIKIGDKVGSKVNKFDDLKGEYKVVGILKGRDMISFVSANNVTMPGYNDKQGPVNKKYIVFPRTNRLKQLNNELDAMNKKELKIDTFTSVNKEFRQSISAIKLVDVISLLAIILMVITVGSTKYVQFFNRKEEIGTLNAIGYNKNQILSRSAVEVILLNFIGFVLGLLLGLILSKLCSSSLFESKGAYGVVFSLKAFSMSLYIPLFTILFTIVPINVIISKLDPISIIENN
ncbi:ABC transporter permease [Clostridium oryzae]|uniref:FtsX-like permease family protein n=1 Tax=Clostridium oryzae TaxID=1450648 RepID=A0A1V4IQG1_9CLOT|nr:FtsX-like permease family protein [Clostridium oryzae]OPJ62261.1 FtsX-like permease family protein [Clostridium oryzae]